MDFASRLKELRTQKGLTQGELSKRLGVSQSSIAMYEQGKREPNYETLMYIAKFFNVPVNDIMGVAWNPPPEFFTDPETGKLVEAMNISDTHKRIILASKDLSPEELNRIADLMETMAESHRKD